ncbi:anthranilate synthase component II [Aliikangiella sp. IMCC44653]
MYDKLKIIMIDNYDSFTYNLVNQFRMLGAEVIVFRNDTELDVIFSSKRLSEPNTLIVISPGPGSPDTAGNTLQIINQYSHLPILGICLGHQAIVQAFGGKVVKAKQVMHGKSDQLTFNQASQFAQATQQKNTSYRVARYHSLATSNIPNELEVLASTNDEIMAVAHKTKPILGFQFHPESILTTHGSQLLSEAINWLLNYKPVKANQ